MDSGDVGALLGDAVGQTSGQLWPWYLSAGVGGQVQREAESRTKMIDERCVGVSQRESRADRRAVEFGGLHHCTAGPIRDAGGTGELVAPSRSGL